jgi:hypothetical protein
VLAHLRGRWCLRDRDGFGDFRAVKRLFSVHRTLVPRAPNAGGYVQSVGCGSAAQVLCTDASGACFASNTWRMTSASGESDADAERISLYWPDAGSIRSVPFGCVRCVWELSASFLDSTRRWVLSVRCFRRRVRCSDSAAWILNWPDAGHALGAMASGVNLTSAGLRTRSLGSNSVDLNGTHVWLDNEPARLGSLWLVRITS